jgi:hypothetical protein
MWNLPIGQWPQFFGALNPMMQMPVGQFAGMQQSSNSNSCAGGQGAVQAPQPQQPVQAGGKTRRKGRHRVLMLLGKSMINLISS